MGDQAEQQNSQTTDSSQSGGNSGQQETRVYNDEQVNAIVAKARRETEAKYSGFDELKSKAEQYDSLTKTAESERDTFKSERDTFKSENEKLQAQLLRQKIGAKEGLDPDLWDRVTGKTAEEIEADVKKLVEKFGTKGSTTVLGSRSGSGASAPDGRTAKQRAAAAFRQLSSQ